MAMACSMEYPDYSVRGSILASRPSVEAFIRGSEKANSLELDKPWRSQPNRN